MPILQIRRTVAAPPEQVWRALTDPSAVNGWFWPHLDPSTEIDLQVDGGYRFAGPAGGIAVKGRYLEVEPPRRLVFTWQWDGDDDPESADEASLVTVGLETSLRGTALSLTHDRIRNGEARDRYAEGWRDCLERLSPWLSCG
jgi:uncharacterized protein YndB with AHSA1/START domain